MHPGVTSNLIIVPLYAKTPVHRYASFMLRQIKTSGLLEMRKYKRMKMHCPKVRLETAHVGGTLCLKDIYGFHKIKKFVDVGNAKEM